MCWHCSDRSFLSGCTLILSFITALLLCLALMLGLPAFSVFHPVPSFPPWNLSLKIRVTLPPSSIPAQKELKEKGRVISRSVISALLQPFTVSTFQAESLHTPSERRVQVHGSPVYSSDHMQIHRLASLEMFWPLLFFTLQLSFAPSDCSGFLGLKVSKEWFNISLDSFC